MLTVISKIKECKNWKNNRPADKIRIEQIKEYEMYCKIYIWKRI